MSDLSVRVVVLELAQHLNISKAAKSLGVTQSAISQRLKKIERELNHDLFIRKARGLTLTPFGARLQKFFKMQAVQEQEFFGKGNSQRGLSGRLVIGAYPSVARSLVLRSLAPMLRANPDIDFELVIRQSYELPALVEAGTADLALIDIPLSQAGLDVEPLGRETYVEIEGTQHPNPDNLYLDLDYRDPATWNFLKMQKRLPKNLKRHFLSDVYAIIHGVEEGLGRAVMPRHLLEKRHRVRIRKGSQAVEFPVQLVTIGQSIRSSLHASAIEQLKKGAEQYL